MSAAEILKLTDFIVPRFSLGELDMLCLRLNIDIESDLSGGNKTDKALSLVRYLVRRDRLAELHQKLAELRPQAYARVFGEPPPVPETARPSGTISTLQLRRLKQRIRDVGRRWGQATGSDEYRQVYGRLWTTYKIRSVEDLPAAQFGPAMELLDAWLAEGSPDAQ